MGLLDSIFGGGEQVQKTEPSQLDIVNAQIAQAIAPYLIAQIFPEMAGVNTANKSLAVQQAVNKGAAQGAPKGSAQMFSNIVGASQPGGKVGGDVMNTALMLYGKQPAQMAGGGSSTATPGLPDYLNSALNIYKVYSAMNQGSPWNTTTIGKTQGVGG